MSRFAHAADELILPAAKRARAAGTIGPLLLATLFIPFTGCRNCDLVEAQLRSRDRDLRELRSELSRTEAYNDAMQREVSALRQGGPASITPEAAAQTYRIKSIQLGRQTGGYDDDNVPGDEALQVHMEPIDPDGHLIKTPGTLYVTALEINGQGVKTPFSSWILTPDELNKRWRDGLLSKGYFVVLPWKNWPTTEKVRVVVRFVLSDDRVFEADKDVTVRLAPPAQRRNNVPIEPWPEAPRRIEPLPPAQMQGPVLSPSFKTTTSYTPSQVPPNYRPAVELMRPIPRPVIE